MRQVVLDTETTGLEPSEGHRIIEIGCVELVNRRPSGNNYHQYIQPGREIDPGAIEVHGITNEFLQDKPVFSDLVDDFISYISGAELVIHNAPFDVGFINQEFKYCNSEESVNSLCGVLDTLALARRIHPGQKNNLDALCKRYDINNSHRDLHGALLDAEILADVYLAMTGGQVSLSLGGNAQSHDANTVFSEPIRRLPESRPPLRVIRASKEECRAHRERLDAIAKSCDGTAVWDRLEGS